MTPDPVLYVIAVAAIAATLALILQAVMMVGFYKAAKAMRDQVTVLAARIESFVESTERSVEQSRKYICDVAAHAGQVLDLAHKQLVRVDEVLGDATSRAKIQMDRVEWVLDDMLSRLHETSAALQKGLLRPIREINGFAAGLQAALGFLFRSRRTTVERATHDEEMYI